MLLQAPFVGRRNFGQLLNRYQLLNIAIEIGTNRGDFALQIMQVWNGGRLYCIDPWITRYNPQDVLSNKESREDDLAAASIQLKEYLETNRAMMVRKESREALADFPDQSIDFVYVDGNHDSKAFDFDLRNWWQKIKPNGIIAGHDFICPNEINGGWGRGIQGMLLPFAEQQGRDIFLVLEETNDPWSFYMFKG